MTDAKIPETGERDGPRVVKSDRGTKRYSKRIIALFILCVAVILFAITMQERFKRDGGISRDDTKNYHAPRPSGFAELAAGMRRDRQPVETVTRAEPKREPETPARRIVIKAGERPVSSVLPLPRYYSNKDDAQAANTLRTLKLQALAARPLVEDFKPERNERESARNLGASSPDGGAGIASAPEMIAALTRQSQAPDPNMQERKTDFLRGEGGALTPRGYSDSPPLPRQFPYELKAGTLIPGIMITGINSDLPGSVMAQVSENVWDTATGKFVLIPKGTRILGVYDSRVSYGQKRILLVWNRLVFPNGTTLDIAGSPGIDQAGYSGLSGRVNEHWGTMLKSALLASVFVAGAEIIYDSDSQSGGSRNKSPRDVAAESAAGAVIDMGAKLVDRAADIQPTITVRPGKRMAIFVQRDVVFPFPYEL